MRTTSRVGSQSVGVHRTGTHKLGRTIAAVGLTAGLIAGVATVAAPAGADGPAAMNNHYSVTNLVSDQAGVAQVTDPNLQNPWGLAAGPTTPIWVADNHTDTSTVYRGDVKGSPVEGPLLVVPVDGGAPTGIVFNSTGGFMVPSAGAPATFIFASEADDITAWSNADPGAHAVVLGSNAGADYKGLAIAESGGAPFLYAASFGHNAVEVYDTSFTMQHWAGAFVDPNLPRHYAPFGIDTIGNEIYVSYALHVPGDGDDTSGPHHGFIDVFGTDGRLHRRLVSRGALDSPWGMTIAPRNFGQFAGALLVGNFGDGRIHAYNRFTGRFLGGLRDADGNPIRIEGLWALEFGNGVFGNRNTLLFSAGPNEETHGLFGSITALDPTP
jgi:uncharacterized protein (TIGR03118 family)